MPTRVNVEGCDQGNTAGNYETLRPKALKFVENRRRKRQKAAQIPWIIAIITLTPANRSAHQNLICFTAGWLGVVDTLRTAPTLLIVVYTPVGFDPKVAGLMWRNGPRRLHFFGVEPYRPAQRHQNHKPVFAEYHFFGHSRFRLIFLKATSVSKYLKLTNVVCQTY
jgi:hypothetical protein